METALTTDFADGTYRFWLPLPQAFELQRSADVSIIEFEQALRDGVGQDADGKFAFLGGGAVSVKAILEVVRLGLIGGGFGMVQGEEIEVGPLRAKELLETYVYPARPLSEAAALAYHIAYAAVFGVKLKKKAPAESEVSATS